METIDTTFCSKCHEEKLVEEFTWKNKTKGTLSSWCKACQSAYVSKTKVDNLTAKICTKCKQLKPLEDFYKHNGYWASQCKACQLDYAKTPHGRATRKAYKKTPNGKISGRTYRQSPRGKATAKINGQKPERKASKIAYQNQHKDAKSEYDRLYHLKHKEKRNAYNRQYNQQNKKKRNKYLAHKRLTDLNFKLASSLRIRGKAAIKNNQKSGSFVKDLGCSIPELKQHLEAQFYPHPITGEVMTWKNWGFGVGKWQIDHKNPLSNFNLANREEFLKACYYTNLQPLWHEDHIKKTAIENTNR
jgi:hypothetical protein